MSDSQQPQTPLARLEQLERQIASKVERVVQGLRREIGEGVRDASEEIQRLLEAAREKVPEPQPESPAPPGPDLSELVGAAARISGQTGQADVIKTLLSETAPLSSRAVFFLVRQRQIRAWSSRGFGSGSGRVEGVHATTDQAPWSSLGSEASVVLDADQLDAFAHALGTDAGAEAAWVPFFLRGQLAGALYVDRLEGEGDLDVAALQLLTHCAALSLETAASSPGVSATLELRGKLPERVADEHTVAVDADVEAAGEKIEAVAEAEEEVEEETEEETEATDQTTTTGEEESDESTEITEEDLSAGGEEEDDSEGEAAAGAAMPAGYPPEMKPPVIAVPDVSVPEPVIADGLPAEAFAAPPEVPEIELGEPESGPPLEYAEAPDVPDIELGEPEPAAREQVASPQVPVIELDAADVVGSEDIALEVQNETPLDEDSNIWEVEDDEPTAVGEDGEEENAVQAAPVPAAPVPAAPVPAAPVPAAPVQEIGNETVRIDTAKLPQHPQTQIPQTPAAAGGSSAVQYPSSFAEPPPPVQALPPSFAEPDTPEDTDEPSAAEVTPPPDTAPARAQPSSQVTPPADATPTSEVAPPRPTGGTTEVAPPSDLEGPGLAFAAPTADQTEREMDDAEEALHEEARRLARLLVSEIKLYNEEIIEEGRRTGNIYDRLKDDINRSRQMYEERIDPRLADQEDYFQQELVQRLAGGDESLLGM